MKSTLEIGAALGRKEMALELGVGFSAVSNAVVAGVFPAKWYLVITSMCEAKGVDCPDSLFTFAAPQIREAS